MGDQTLTVLSQQDEQLKRVQATTQNIDTNLEQSKNLLQSMRPLGWLNNLFKRNPKAPANQGQTGDGGYTNASMGTSAGGSQASSAAADVARGSGAARLLEAD